MLSNIFIIQTIFLKIDCYFKDLKAIEELLNELPTSQGFPAGSRPFVYQTVVEFNEFAIKVGDYYDTGMIWTFIW